MQLFSSVNFTLNYLPIPNEYISLGRFPSSATKDEVMRFPKSDRRSRA